MRVAFLTAANSWHIPVKTKYFVKEGHEVSYLQIFPGTGQSIVPNGVNCVDIKSDLPNPFGHIHKLFIVHKLSQRMNLDIVHIIGMGNAIYAFFLKAKKIVFENNGSDVLVLPNKYKVLKYVYKYLYKKADAVVQDSQGAKDAGIQCGAPIMHNEIIELGIDFDVFHPQIKKNIARSLLGLKDQKIVFSPRGFTELYNIETIIRSIPYVKNIITDVVYVFCRHFGQDEKYYDALVNKLNVADNVLFTGFLDNEKELPFYYIDSSVVVSVPSSDSSPRSVYEAIACHKPVIISDIPWYHSKFDKDKDIFVVPVKDEVKLSEVIVKVLLGKEIRSPYNAYNVVQETIGMIENSKRMEQLYSGLLMEE